jgi:hypothetical protein
MIHKNYKNTNKYNHKNERTVLAQNLLHKIML